MTKKRKITIITGSRAEYGLLYWLMHEIHEDPDLELQIIATGMHLSPEFGLTYKQIEADGFQIDAKVEMLMSSDSTVGITKSIGLGVIGFADAYHLLNPDLIVVLGDRYEILAAAQAAMIARIPVAHLCGGESCGACIDEPIRHAITKMSHLHFVTAELHQQRVIQMGEHPDHVFNVGTPGLDHLTRSRLLDKEALEEKIDFKFGKINFLVTYHNVTLKKQNLNHIMAEIFKALDQYPEAKIIFTRQNSDTDSRIIGTLIEDYLQQNRERGKLFTSMGSILYLSAMKHCDVVLGNSSSALVEAPCLKKPTVNIGDRQKGRLKATSIINCSEQAEHISLAIEKALSPEFQQQLEHVESPYGMSGGHISLQIKEMIKSIDLSDILVKNFYDLKADMRWERC